MHPRHLFLHVAFSYEVSKLMLLFQCLDFEVELAFVISKEGKNIQVGSPSIITLDSCNYNIEYLLSFFFRPQKLCHT